MKYSMMALCLWAGLFLSPFGMHSQEKITTKSKKAIDAYNKALEYYTQKNYGIAEDFFLIAIEDDPGFIEAYLVLAELYEESDQPLKAIDIYRRGLPLKEDYFPYGFIKLGNLEYREGFYEKALSSYNKFLSLNSGNATYIERAREGISRCEFSIEAKDNPVDFKPVNLGPSINTPSDEYWPSLSADEQTLVITRLIQREEFMKKVQEDFFISHWMENGWEVMKNAGSPLNTDDNEGAQALSGDGRLMVFTACNRKDGLGRCDLYFSVKEGDRWTFPRNFGRPVNTAYRETQPSITPDGRTLYFSSDRPGGKGLHDIWVTHRDDHDQWSNPENLGEIINTRGIEMSPFIHPDNQSFYFSSDGHIGLGGYDLFVSRKDSSGKWQKPVNLGYPINTNRDEIGLIVNSRGDKAYYSSDVDKTNGKDIFVFDLPVQNRPFMVTYMKGKVFDADHKQLLRAQFELLDLETGEGIYRSFSDSITGEFLISIPVDHNYALNVSRRDYLFYSENFSLKNTYQADKPYLKDIPLQPIKVGNRIILRNVFYETDSYALLKESTAELNKLVSFLQANPGIRIEVGGHTDNTGSADYNQKLSENRAKTVADFLISESIRADRIVAIGYGMNLPVATNNTEEGRAQNRRTELKIIE
jgi:outer membrane protein OmpA-like peptidoglycan-associated protein